MTCIHWSEESTAQPCSLFFCEEGKVDGQDISKGVSFHVVCMTVNPFAAQMNPWNVATNADGIVMVLLC